MKLVYSVILLALLGGGLFLVGSVARADCDAGTPGADNITCDNIPAAPGDDVEANTGNDTVTVDAGTTVTDVDADANDNAIEGGPGNDTITNNGSVQGDIDGDGITHGGNGADSIVNNGTVDTCDGAVPDCAGQSGEIEGGPGNDTITNNGSVQNDIEGDQGFDSIVNSATGTVGGDIDGGPGADTITNDGTVVQDLHGQGGNDLLTNNGSIGEDFEGDDPPGPQTGNDTMLNNGTVGLDMRGGNGDDSVTNNGSVGTIGAFVGTVTGGSGNDTVSNTVNGMVGCVLGGGMGDDTVINDGTVGCAMLGRQGNDSIVNNGSVVFDIVGDFSGGVGGNDTIINNGTVDDFIVGDDACAAGNDSIVNNGSAGIILGDVACGGGGGNDTIIHRGTVDIIDALEGNDSVSIQFGALVNDTLFGILGGEDPGDGDFDVISFSDLTQAVSDEIANQCPDPDFGCTIMVNGFTYRLAEFESLQLFLIVVTNDVANVLEDAGIPIRRPEIICDDGVVKVIRDEDNNQWVFSGFNLLPDDGFLVALLPFDQLFPNNVFSNPGAPPEGQGWTAVLDNTLHTRVFDAAGNLISDRCLYRDEPNDPLVTQYGGPPFDDN